ncbi:TPA: ADP-ribosylglycohydrolase family protein [Clostridium botulinum]|uniref:ADP-ribosylglycohydrolase family protein n=1 Tax=Clostridium sporogenes TaxID=1509 RepID=UPI000773FD52|nr:ADP-ribosylglycohydrolase family protein [Clostridium sporogenes]AUM93864.1 hypothetical protein RSJ11_01280 [Clostridium sporogenes]HBJ2613767.1 ADP-ribosylglycohydrolase family protein [Clostridium botulinum]
MIGSIIGDIVGSSYELMNTNKKDFNLYRKISRFTDDTVLTISTADCLLREGNFKDFYRTHTLKYPLRGYGSKFLVWAYFNKKNPNYSFGNGGAMRVAPIAYIFNDLYTVLEITEKSCIATHNHPEGIKGAKAIAACIYLARQDCSKEEIKQYIENEYKYNLNISVEEFHSKYRSNATCQNSIPQAIVAFLESTDFESCLRNAIYIGGDSDTVSCMACGIAEAYYKEIPYDIFEFCFRKLNNNQKSIIKDFYNKYIVSSTITNKINNLM